MGFGDLLRMTAEDFEVLLRRVAPLITKRDTQMRLAITAKERLALTLRFLATGWLCQDMLIGGFDVLKVLFWLSCCWIYANFCIFVNVVCI